MRECKICGGCLPLEMFSPSKRGKDGLHSYCRPCRSGKAREYMRRRRRAAKVMPKWSEAENAVVANVYPDGGWEGVRALLPHRSKDAITKCASRLRVRANSVFSVPRDGKRWRGAAESSAAPDTHASLRNWRYPATAGQLTWRV